MYERTGWRSSCTWPKLYLFLSKKSSGCECGTVSRMLNWIFFVVLSVIGYVCISIFGRLVGPDSTSFVSAVTSAFKPVPLAVVMLGNALLGGALYYGFLSTSFAIPVAISVGVVTSVVYSSFALGLSFTLTKCIGVLFIIVGIYLLK